MSYYNYCWTLNNYTPLELVEIETLVETYPNVAYVCYGAEIGEAGTIHLQGYVEFKKKVCSKGGGIVLPATLGAAHGAFAIAPPHEA